MFFIPSLSFRKLQGVLLYAGTWDRQLWRIIARESQLRHLNEKWKVTEIVINSYLLISCIRKRHCDFYWSAYHPRYAKMKQNFSLEVLLNVACWWSCKFKSVGEFREIAPDSVQAVPKRQSSSVRLVPQSPHLKDQDEQVLKQMVGVGWLRYNLCSLAYLHLVYHQPFLSPCLIVVGLGLFFF